MSNAIVTENANAGDAGWDASTWTEPGNNIQAYLGQCSVDPGGSLDFYVSTLAGGTTYRIDVYRLGYYAGVGGRLMTSVTGLTGTAQGYWDYSNKTLNNAPTVTTSSDGKHLVEANWTKSYTLSIPANWCTGSYIAKVTDQNGFAYGMSFVVRSKGPADYVAIRPFLTDAAYNAWGGWSLYTTSHAYAVSFDKPQAYDGASARKGTAGALVSEACSIQWMESQGYSLCYLADLDVHANPGWLLNFGAVVSLGHDEYWTKERRDGTESAIAKGVGLCVWGANCCYWQVRLSTGASGRTNGTVTCYKVSGSANGPNYSLDPFWGVDNTRLTCNWREAIVGRPESTMIGLLYGLDAWGDTHFGDNLGANNVAWTCASSAAGDPYLNGTGLTAGSSYGVDIVGFEWDPIGIGSPATVKALGATAKNDSAGRPTTSSTVYWTSPNGAMIFAGGSLSFSWALASWRYQDNGSPHVVAGLQAMMANIFPDLLKGIQKRMAPTGQGNAYR